MYKNNNEILEKVRRDLEETGFVYVCNKSRGPLFPRFMTERVVICPDRYCEKRVCKIECDPNSDSKKVSRTELKHLYGLVIKYKKENAYLPEERQKLEKEMEFLGLKASDSS